MSISVLTDDVLVEIFDYYLGEDAHARNHKGWYKLTHTCRRWRHIIFSFPSCLHVHLYCTYGSPVADMLSHLLPFPLIINYDGQQPLSPKDKEGVLLALQKHDHICSISLCASTSTLDKLFAAKVGLIRNHPTSCECDTVLHLILRPTAKLFQCLLVAETLLVWPGVHA